MLPGFAQFFEQEQAAPLPYDAEVQYLESTGTQWIDTLFTATGGCVMEFSFATSDFGNSCVPMGSHSKTSANAYNRNVVVLNSKNYLSFCKCEKYGQSYSGGVDMSSGFHEFYFDSRGYGRIGKLDGTIRISDTTQYELAPDTSVVMWKYRWDDHIMSGRFSYAKIRNANEVLVRDFVPVRVGSGSSAVGYMYDRVSGTLFGNAGTGAFTVGPDK